MVVNPIAKYLIFCGCGGFFLWEKLIQKGADFGGQTNIEVSSMIYQLLSRHLRYGEMQCTESAYG